MSSIWRRCPLVFISHVGLLGLVWLGSGGCARSGAAVQAFPVCAVDPDELYRRSRAVFERAILYQPDEAHADPLTAVLAPLVVWERGATSTGSARLSGPGVVFRTPDGAWRVDDTQPAVYVDIGSSFVAGGVRSQTALVWCQEVARSESLVEVVCRGLRVTSDAAGYPLAWEVLDPKWRGHVIYVAETVESKARSQYGSALPGRRYSVERSLADERDTVVPRVLSDGPIPMGPYVYLEGTRGEVSGVLCRCMDSQVNQFTETRRYHVLPLAELGSIGRSLVDDTASLPARLRWPDGIE